MKALICMRELPFAEATIRFGGLVADLLDASVTLMTVVHKKDDDAAKAQTRLLRAQELLESPVISAKICHGDPASEILGETRAQGYELVVVGKQDGISLINSLLGTVTSKVATRAQSCVLVVNEERRNLDRILICTAGEVDQGVVRVGARLAQRAEAETTVLHVANPVPTMYTGLEAMEETLPELLQRDTPVAGHLRDSARRLAEKEVEAEVQLRYGEATDQILREARSGDYDLVVIGPGAPAGSLRRFLMTEVTSEVVARAPCPVLVVRGGCRQ